MHFSDCTHRNSASVATLHCMPTKLTRCHIKICKNCKLNSCQNTWVNVSIYYDCSDIVNQLLQIIKNLLEFKNKLKRDFLPRRPPEIDEFCLNVSQRLFETTLNPLACKTVYVLQVFTSILQVKTVYVFFLQYLYILFYI